MKSYIDFIKYRKKDLKITFEFWDDCLSQSPIDISNFQVIPKIKSSLGNEFDLINSSFELTDPINGEGVLTLADDILPGEYRIEFYLIDSVNSKSVQINESVKSIGPYKLRLRGVKFTLNNSELSSPFHKTLIKVQP
jgi:hypothetical protein